MRFEKLWVPQIEYDAAAFSNAVHQPSKDVAICSDIEMSEALTHHDRGVERFRRRLIIPDVGGYVIRAAGQFACVCDRICVTVNSGYRLAAIRKCSPVSSHAAAELQNFAEIGARRTTTAKFLRT